MPLSKSSLADALEQVFNSPPASATDAAQQWANAYAAYAAQALSSATSLPANAAANFSILLGGFQAGLAALTSTTAGALVSQGIVAFWQAAAWVGPTAAGTTVFPGNPALAAALADVFADLSGKSSKDKASDLADAFDAGARSVVVSDVPFIQPAPPIIGPIQ